MEQIIFLFYYFSFSVNYLRFTITIKFYIISCISTCRILRIIRLHPSVFMRWDITWVIVWFKKHKHHERKIIHFMRGGEIKENETLSWLNGNYGNYGGESILLKYKGTIFLYSFIVLQNFHNGTFLENFISLLFLFLSERRINYNITFFMNQMRS